MSPFAARLHTLRFRTLLAEVLECRCLLAGNVTATFSEGELRLFGDAKNNAVEVRAVGEDLLVQGFNSTRVNGQSEVVVAGGALLLTDLQAVMGNGHDQLRILDLTLAGNVQLGQGQVDTLFDAGNDQIWLEDLRIGGDLRINAGAGADCVTLSGVAVLGTTELRGGSGSDKLQIIDSALADLTLDAGKGNDLVTIDSSVVGSGANVQLGLGNDTLRILGDSVLGSGAFLNGNRGHDQLQVDDEATLIEFVSLLSLEVQTVV